MNNKGLTLVEAMTALVMITLVIVTLMPVLINFQSINRKSELRSGAVDAAEVLLERYRTLEIGGSLPTSPQTNIETVSVGGRNYETTTLFCQTASYCDSETTHIKVEVNYLNEKLYDVETIYTNLN